VLGVENDQSITEAEIAKALDSTARVKLRKGSTILLIQSGAMFPDEPMVNELNRYVNCVPFTGVPTGGRRSGDVTTEKAAQASYSKSLRLAAARGGCETIVCYWGILESARKGTGEQTGLVGAGGRLGVTGRTPADAHPVEDGGRGRARGQLVYLHFRAV